ERTTLFSTWFGTWRPSSGWLMGYVQLNWVKILVLMFFQKYFDIIYVMCNIIFDGFDAETAFIRCEIRVYYML
ncbi:hypothetical protein ACP3WA_25815, partial [Salmonella enterica]|uniref:hypothetical protein n=1 Tax=Salmonella enterica TaxID=28901 RepID=UPI003CF17D72